MKNLQKFAVALLVGIMAIGFSAFTNNKEVNRAGLYWYYHTPNTPASYVAKGQSTNPPGDISCPDVETDEEICLKGFTVDPGLSNAATAPATEVISREISN